MPNAGATPSRDQGVIGLMVVGAEGLVVKSTFDVRRRL
jgi:predicted regulator of Ras-like GTPase activity (Roadblock/LC7/MglB family)